MNRNPEAVIVDGRAIAADILAKAKAALAAVPGGMQPIVRAVTVSPTPATLSYLRIKTARAEDAGMSLDLVHLPDAATEEEVIAAIQAPGADSVIVQLPLPAHLDRDRVLSSIPIQKDADVLSSAAYERFAQGTPGALLPPVVCAIAEVLARAGIDPAGKRVVVVGSGKLVGEPAALYLGACGSQVDILTRDSFEQGLALLKEADIVIAGAGSPHLIQPEMLAPGVVLIDAGTSEQEGAIAGDADPSCAQVASVFTPVPGGMGPIAVACLFKNVAVLVSRA